MPRIVLFGASGYTGALVAEHLCHHGLRPVLAGRDPVRLRDLAENLGPGVEVAAADAAEPESIAALLGAGLLRGRIVPLCALNRPCVR